MPSDRRPPFTYPFLYGAEYYRAPTPPERYWAEDLKRMAASGFNAVKFFVQWRWVHRKPAQFFFEDHDRLMDIAGECGLSVTINLIFDMAPAWLFETHPDCLMVTASGVAVEPRSVSCRSVGGYPGPCLNHPRARAVRDEFTQAVVSRYAGHGAMGMWDVWNEPESCLLFRYPPRPENLLCYCPHCRRVFQGWLRTRYGLMDRLNDVWGRCYADWSEVELPRDPGTYTDMVDWRLFQLDSLAADARRRIAAVKAIDRAHPVYLHPVPNTMACFNSITGVDDFRIAEGCDCFGGTTNGVPVSPLQIVSAAQGRPTYNVESHLRAGSTALYPRPLTVRDIADSLIPQIGLGIRGFLYWQYRAETLGAESPAWGLLDTDGREGTTHDAAAAFWKRLQPVAERLMAAPVEPPEVAILKSTANEIFHWCMCGSLDGLRLGIEGYTQLLYEKNCRLTYVDDRGVVDGLPAGVKLLVVPECYALTQPVADALAAWVRRGGALLCEAHTGGYDLTLGRHSGTLPGLGLAEAFGIHEHRATAVVHLGVSERTAWRHNVLPDVAKALDAYGVAGGESLPLRTIEGSILLGASRYAELEGEALEPIASLPGRPPCVALKRVGRGEVLYLGTLAGRVWARGSPSDLPRLADRLLKSAGMPLAAERWPGVPDGVRLDALKTPGGTAWALSNRCDDTTAFSFACAEPMQGLFTGQRLSGDATLKLEAGQADLFVPADWLEVT